MSTGSGRTSLETLIREDYQACDLRQRLQSWIRPCKLVAFCYKVVLRRKMDLPRIVAMWRSGKAPRFHIRDLVLVLAFRANRTRDSLPWKILDDENRPDLIRAASKQVQGISAEEAVNDVLSSCWERAQKANGPIFDYEGRCALKSWLIGYLLLKLRRKPPPPGGALIEDPPAPEPPLLTEDDEQDICMILREAFALLGLTERRALNAVFCEKRLAKDVAKTLKKTPDNFSHFLRQTLERLAKTVADRMRTVLDLDPDEWPRRRELLLARFKKALREMAEHYPDILGDDGSPRG